MDSFSQGADIFLDAMKQEGEKKEVSFDGGPLKAGTVVQVTDTGVFLDMGSKSEAYIDISEFEQPPALGDVIHVVMKEIREGLQIASIKAAGKFQKQDEIRRAYHQGYPVKGTIESVILRDSVPKGFNVDLGAESKAFLPLSQIDTRKVQDLQELVGKSFDFAIIEYRRNSATVSRREYLRKTIRKVYEEFFGHHQVGDVITGKVEDVDQNFLILGVEGIRAFLHISDFSWKYLTDLHKIVKQDDEFEVKIISMDKSKDSVKVGRKQLLENPWDTADDRFALGDLVKAKVVRFRRDAAVVELEDGIEGFLPTSEMSWTQKVKDPKHFLKIGSIVEVKIKNLETDKKRIDVSLRDVQDNPWESAEETYTHGRKLKGKVSSILDFGLFIKFEDGIEGLLRKEDVDWMDANINLKQKFKKGDEIEVVVISLDAGREKLRLGIKQMSDNPLRTFQMNYPKGAVVEAKVKELLDNGISVELENNLEGFIHISQLAKDNVEKAEDVVKVGDEIQVLVKYVDVAKNKIELSRKEFLVTEEKREVQKYIVSESGEGENSATLGSLLKDQLKNLNLTGETKKTKEPKEKKEVKEAKETKTVKSKSDEPVKEKTKSTAAKKKKEEKAETSSSESEAEISE